MIKLGLNTWLWAVTFGEEDLYCIDEIARLGAEAIDLSVNDPFHFPAAKAAEKLKQAKAAGITDGTRPRGFATREEVALMVAAGKK